MVWNAPHTEAKVVRSVDRASQEFLVACGEGEPGFIVARCVEINQ